jgi:hypothetical protein
MWGFLAGFGLLSRFRVAYFVALAIILGSLVLEHWLARRRSLKWITRRSSAERADQPGVLHAVVIEVVFPGFRITR